MTEEKQLSNKLELELNYSIKTQSNTTQSHTDYTLKELLEAIDKIEEYKTELSEQFNEVNPLYLDLELYFPKTYGIDDAYLKPIEYDKIDEDDD